LGFFSTQSQYPKLNKKKKKKKGNGEKKDSKINKKKMKGFFKN